MRSLTYLLVLVTWSVTACPASAQYALVDAYPSLTFNIPTDIQNAGDERMFVVEKGGLIYVIDGGVASVFLDLSGRVTTKRESGALGLAFPPDHAASGDFFVFYTQATPHVSVISRFSVVDGNPDLADPASELRLLEIPKQDYVHNGGQLAMDPRTKYLYISVGDDRIDANAQDPETLHGSILRIDPYHPSGGRNYGIPDFNPEGWLRWGWRPEILAIGLRNPWRMCLDPARGTVWVGDVGEAETEEIDFIESGGNYGWPILEGNACYASCDTAGADLVAPVFTYSHAVGIAVIGGQVYRGRRLWQLIAHYIFGDYLGGTIWAFNVDAHGPKVVSEVLTGAPGLLCAGSDIAGEVYFGSTDGHIYRLESTATAARPPGTSTPAALGAPYPNPFNPTVHIPVSVSSAGRVTLRIHDVSGARVATLLDGRDGPLEATVGWDGRRDRGGRVAAGVYFAVLELDGTAVARRRLVLVK